jgi:formate dehydrogenase beta subunit
VYPSLAGKLCPPCQVACPIHTDVRGYAAAIARGDFEEAYALARGPNPLVYACSHVCAHPCEEACRRNNVDEPVAILALKRFATEYHDVGLDHARPRPDVGYRDQKVAIIGGGPAGLTAAHDLALMGYEVTVFEAESQAGGMLRLGLPKYRLPREIIEKDVRSIADLGVDIRTGVRVGEDVTIGDLREQGYEAIFIGVGAGLGRSLPLEGIDLDGVLVGLEFLGNVNRGRPVELGRRIVVIGGGNVAIDVARTAVRQASPGDEKEVHMMCLECREEMPAHEWEIEEALKEGIVVHPSLGPQRILGQDGKVTGVQTIVCSSVFDDQGRFNPSYAPGTEGVIEGDTVILAIGQASELSLLGPEDGVNLTRRRTIEVDERTLATSAPGIFAGGEVTIGPSSVVESMSLGHRAAAAMDAYLRGEDLASFEWGEPEELGELAEKTIQKVMPLERADMPSLPLEQRRFCYDEVELGYTLHMAVRAAHRCLTCGAGASIDSDKCATCLTCLRLCPYEAPHIENGKVAIDIAQCQACGLCVSECPAKAISLTLYDDGEILSRVERVFEDAPANNPEPFIVGFCCQYCAYAEDEWAADVRAQLPDNVRTVDVLCTSKIDTLHLLKAFELGADGVFVVGCMGEECRYTERATNHAQGRIKHVQGILDEIGLGGERLAVYDTSAAEWGRVPQIAAEMTDRVREMGPNPLSKLAVSA